MRTRGGDRRKLPDGVKEAIYAWGDLKERLGPRKAVVARHAGPGLRDAVSGWAANRKAVGTAEHLAKRLGIARSTVYHLLSKRRSSR